MNKKEKEPLFHVVKRQEMRGPLGLIVRAVAILLALIVCALVTTLLTGADPIKVYGTIIYGAFGSARKTWVTCQNIAVLLIISLAVTPAFRMRFWNCGAEGQVLVGGLASAACMITLADRLPNIAVIILMIISSLAAGALWGLLPAVCKAKWSTNETLSTLMMNYIGLQLVSYFTVVWESPKGSGKIGIINQSSNIGWLPEIGNKYLLSIIVAIAVTVFLNFYIYQSKQGYEICVVGESERTAKYVGINVPAVIVRTMAISGALCGLAGLLLVGGINHTVTPTIAGGQGFTAIMVSWLAKFNPLIMILTSFLIVFLGRGAGEIATVFELNQSFADILKGIILFFIIGCEFFINYRVVPRGKN